MEPILQVQNLSISFTQYVSAFRQAELHVIRDLNLTIQAGEMVAVVGSSGSGKSLLAHGILGILPYNASMRGNISFLGEPLTQKRIGQIRGSEVVLVPQSVNYLDPLMKVGPQVAKGKRDESTRQNVANTFARYGLDASTAGLYPFQLSGGMARRVLISTAVMESPKLVIADEPTPGLHIESAKRVLGHFREMADAGAGVLLITHDLELALEVADRVAVFYAGSTIEEAAVTDFEAESKLRHPYTKALWRAMPQNGFMASEGSQPYAGDMPKGCPYAPRCAKACAACAGEIPYMKKNGGYVRCVDEGDGT